MTAKSANILRVSTFPYIPSSVFSASNFPHATFYERKMASNTKVNMADSKKIQINAVTTKGEVAGLLYNQGIMELYAELLRKLFEGSEEDWPQNPKEFLLDYFTQQIPFVKQMTLMKTNFLKRLDELEIMEEEKKIIIKDRIREAREKELRGPSFSAPETDAEPESENEADDEAEEEEGEEN